MDKKIRTGQLISTFGIGQIVTFPEEVSLMIGGLNLWDESLERREIEGGPNSINESELNIQEERLQRLLNVNFFRKPFPYQEQGDTNKRLEIPGVRFPGWFHCPFCGRMKQKELEYRSDKVECLEAEGGCGQRMIPVRFIAACEHGHIQDVPFIEWVHNGTPEKDMNHELSYKAGSGSGDLGSIFILCTCGQSKSLAGIMNVKKSDDSNKVYYSALAGIGLSKETDEEFNESNPLDYSRNPSGQFCRGYKPWLGKAGVENPDKCRRHLRVLVRGGSNVHYANIQSAIFLPKIGEDVNECVQRVIDENPGGLEQFKELYEQQRGGGVLKAVLSTQSVVKKNLITIDELFDGIVSQFDDSAQDEETYDEKDIRWDEYQHIIKGRDSENCDFKAVVKSLNEYEDRDFLERFFSTVVLIEKLKETRVFTGFSRINPNIGNLEERKRLLSNQSVKWLPAYQVHGEGIFLEFNSSKLNQWVKKSEGYFSNLLDRYHHAIRQRKPEYKKRDIGPIFIMMHTFAHLLIKRLCYNCGYGSSSLRERIYYSSEPDRIMNGILIYTSSGDSEGSLGGLVRQGKEHYLAKLVRDSIADAEWCSADPVCSEVGQESGQGPDSINGSACHNCCLVPETSCEEFNTILDRATIVGTIDNPSVGYFD